MDKFCYDGYGKNVDVVEAYMKNITELYDMLDWNQPEEIQANGVHIAKSLKEIPPFTDAVVPFLRPRTPKHTKSIWDNCALIISGKSDEELKPHLVELMEWLKDMNWPGAFCIFDRLKEYSDDTSFNNAAQICIEKAKKIGKEIWLDNLYSLIRDRV